VAQLWIDCGPFTRLHDNCKTNFNAFVVVQLLLDQGALAEHQDSEGCITSCWLVMPNIVQQDNDGCAPFMIDVELRHFDVFSLLSVCGVLTNSMILIKVDFANMLLGMWC
jgi:hypothetical protein